MPQPDGETMRVYCPLCDEYVVEGGSIFGYIRVCNTLLWRQVRHMRTSHGLQTSTTCWCGYGDGSYSGLTVHVENEHGGLLEWLRVGLMITMKGEQEI